MEPLPLIALPVATLVYLLIDIYPTAKSFRAIFQTASFWLLFLVFIVLNIIAWAAIEVAAGKKAREFVGRPDVASLLLIVLATLGTVTLLQSFTLKLSDAKLVDLGPVVDNYRRAVLVGVGENVRTLQRRKEQKAAMQIAAQFASDLSTLRAHYHTAFSFGGMTTAQIGADLTKLEDDAKANGLSVVQLMAENIVKADFPFAKSLL